MADNEEVHYERERSRSRDRGDSDHDEDRAPNGSQDDGYKNDRNGEERRQEEEQPEVHNLYVTNLSFQTTDESLKAAFEPYGDVHSASIIKEPVTRNSRGFGFVSFVSIDECEKALDAMHGADVDGRSIKVEKARRAGGYQKTPGVYLGPAGLSARFTRDDDRRGGDRYDRGGHRGGYDRDAPRGGGGYRGDYRDVRDRDPRGGYGGGGYMGGRDDGRYPPQRGGMPPAGYPGRSMPPGGMYRDDRGYGHEPRYDAYPRRDGPPPRFDDRGRGPPPMAMGGPRGGMPPAGYYDGPPRGGMPPGGPGPVGGPMGPGGPMMRGDRRSRSPPPGDSRGRPMGPPGGGVPGPGFDRGGPPSGGYGGGAGYYNAGAGAGGPPRGGRY